VPTGVKTSRSSSVTSRPAFWSEDRVGGKASISAAQDWVLGVLSLEVWYVIMGDSPVRSVDHPGVNDSALLVWGGSVECTDRSVRWSCPGGFFR
jgi:hypothetical protein